ncbi:hypothetical protein [Noviherbaspirillum pedocola]|nr:hypothetical protein [Noviherbaspirillum pedocola]
MDALYVTLGLIVAFALIPVYLNLRTAPDQTPKPYHRHDMLL